MADLGDLVNLGNLITQVRGQEKTTRTSGGTTTETTRKDISDDGVNQLIRDILSGPGGVQNIGGAARRAGVYDSATEELLLGNLYATAANQAEAARAPTIRETTTPDSVTTTEIPGMGLGPMAGTLAATSMAAPLVGKASEAISGGAIGDVLGGIFGGGGGNAAASAGTNFMSNVATGGISQGLGVAGGISGNAINAANAVAGNAGASALGNVLPGAGGFLSGILGGEDQSPLDIGASIASGFAMGGPVGAGVAALGSVLGKVFGGGGSVICTALMERELLDPELYAAGSEYLKSLDYNTVNGYHYWAVGVAGKIRAGSKFWTSVCLPLARSRTALLATDGTVTDHIRYPLGTLTKFVGEPLCWVVGKALSVRERIYG